MGRQHRRLQQRVAMGFICHIVALSVALEEGHLNKYILNAARMLRYRAR